jgi:hypothetical protein
MSLTTRVTALAQSVGADIKSLLSGLSGKVDKATGFGLSSNDYTTTEKTKLANLAGYGITVLTIPAGGAVDLSTTTTNVVSLSGNVAIASFGTMPEGTTRILQFTGAGSARVLTSSANIVIPGSIDFQCLAGASVILHSLGSGVWKVDGAIHADGTGIIGFAGGTLTSALGEAPPVGLSVDASGVLGYNTLANTVLVSHASGAGGVFSSMAVPPTTGIRRLLIFQGAYALTPSSTLLVPGNAALTTASGDTVEAVYLGSNVWRLFNYQKAGSPSSTAVSVVEVQATAASQTSFTIPGGYIVGTASPIVWLSGALLEKSEYTATNGTTVVLTTASTSLADKMTVMSFTTLSMLATAMVGSSASAAGVAGLVPTPVAGDQVKFLRGDGTFATAGSSAAIGDVLYSASPTTPTNHVLPSTVYTQAAYPELFAIVGNIEANAEYAARTTITPWATATQSGVNSMASGQSKVLVAVGTTTSSGLGVGRRSTDGGVTWTNIATLTGTGIPALGQVATDGAGVWVVTVPGGARVYRSTDNGVTFTAIYPTTFAPCRAIDTDKKGVWVACSDTGGQGYRSTDNGATWTAVGATPGGVPVDLIVSDGISAWFTVSPSFAGIGGSYDNGTSWTMTISCAAPATTVYSAQGMTIAVCPGLGTLLTTDAGINWKSLNLEGSRGGGHSIVITPEGTIVIYTGPYLRVSYDKGETWTGSRVTTYGAMFPISHTFDSDGNCIARNDKTTADTAVYYRLTRSTNYTTSTQFKTPAVKATKGLNAYIRAKL